jgi:hypothetical protein
MLFAPTPLQQKGTTKDNIDDIFIVAFYHQSI